MSTDWDEPPYMPEEESELEISPELEKAAEDIANQMFARAFAESILKTLGIYKRV